MIRAIILSNPQEYYIVLNIKPKKFIRNGRNTVFILQVCYWKKKLIHGQGLILTFLNEQAWPATLQFTHKVIKSLKSAQSDTLTWRSIVSFSHFLCYYTKNVIDFVPVSFSYSLQLLALIELSTWKMKKGKLSIVEYCQGLE